jgi:adenylate cyclase class 2
MEKEIEATFLDVDKNQIRGRLLAAHFKLVTPEYLMRRKTFDFSQIAPGENKWGRVRQEANQITMTIKHVKGSGINDTYELELVVDDFNNACEMFQQCGAPAKSFQENYRELWEREGVEVTMDTWPGLNPFVEVEGGSEEIVRAISQELGFDFSTAIFGSIDLIYEKITGIPASTIIQLPEITFEKPPRRK